MNLISKFVSAWVRPFDSMQALKDEGLDSSIKPSIIFILAMGLLAGLVTAIVGSFGPAPTLAGEVLPKAMIWLSVILVPVISFVGSFIGAGIIWGIITGFVTGKAFQYKSIYRILAIISAFSPVTAVLGAIPKVGQYVAIAINIWATIVMIRGVIIVLDTKPVRSWITLGLVFGLLFLLGVMARIATENNLRATPNLTDFGSAEDDMGAGAPAATNPAAGTADINKQMEDLANQAKNDAKQGQAEQKK